MDTSKKTGEKILNVVIDIHYKLAAIPIIISGQRITCYISKYCSSFFDHVKYTAE